jgi:hypothetical protein
MATLLKVLNNLADIKSAGGVALRVRTQDAGIESIIGKVSSICGPALNVPIDAVADHAIAFD